MRTQAVLILHPSALILSMWPDSGLTRNTRDLRCRCSVPGLAGFTKASVVRSPKPDNLSKLKQEFSLSKRAKSNRRLAMREHSQQSINREVQQDVRNYRNYDGQ